MNSRTRLTLIFGIFLPMCLATLLVCGAVGFLMKLRDQAAMRSQTYNALQAYGPALKAMQQEVGFLNEEMPSLPNTSAEARLAAFIQQLQARVNQEAGMQLNVSEAGPQHYIYGPRAYAASMELQGLSGQILPILGELFKAHPGVFTESWSLSMNSEQNRLLIFMVLVAPQLATEK